MTRPQQTGPPPPAEHDLAATLLDTIDALVIVVDTEGRIVHFNRTCERTTGYRAAAVQGKDVDEVLVAPATEGHDAGPLKAALAGRSRPHCDVYVKTATGQLRLIRWSCTELQDDGTGAPRAVGTGIDITERARAEGALRESRRWFQVLARFAPVGIFRTDVVGNLLYCNDCWCRLAGLTEHEALGVGWQQAVHPQDSARVATAWSAATEEGREFHDECRFSAAPGQANWVIAHAVPTRNDAGDVTGYLGTITDTTAVKQAEEALREAHLKLEAIVEASPVAIVAVDNEGAVRLWNQSAERVFGFSEAEVLGRPLPIIPPATVDEAHALTERIMRGETLTGVEVHRLRKDGTEVLVSLSATCLRDAQGDIVGRMAVLQDITERKRTEEQRETTIELLRVINADSTTPELAAALTGLVRRASGCEAVAIRLLRGADFPYYEAQGFSAGFILTESSLLASDPASASTAPGASSPLECICGAVIRGEACAPATDLTPDGTFWRNDLAGFWGAAGAVPGARLRQSCQREGYESMALLPLRAGGEVIGLLQCADPQPGRFTPELVWSLEQLANYVAVALAHRLAEDALRASERRFRELTDLLPDLVYEADTDLRLTYANRKSLETLGYTSDDLTRGLHLSDFLLPQDAVAAAEGLAALAKSEHPAVSRYDLLCKDGTVIPFEISSVAIRSTGGACVGFRGVLRDISERQRAEEDRERMLGELQQHQQHLQSLSRRLVEVQEQERRRVAAELHGGVSQSLTCLGLLIEMAQRAPTIDAAQAMLGRGRDSVTKIMDQVRALSVELRPSLLDDLGLQPALLWLFEQFATRSQLHVAFKHTGIDRRFARDLETTVYRITQEALANVVYHAGTDEATVRIWANQGTIGLQVEDAGCGFDLQEVENTANAMGLSSMRERAAIVGGSLTVMAAPGEGTLIECEFPLSPDDGPGA